MSDESTTYIGKETKETGVASVSFLAGGIGNRISAAADLIGTRTAAAAAMGVSVDSLQRYIREERVPPLDASAALSRSSGVRLEWLAFAEEPMRVAAVGPGSPGKLGFGQGLHVGEETAPHSHSQHAGHDADILADAIATVRAVESALDVELSAKATARVILLACEYIKAGNTAAQLVAAISAAVRKALHEQSGV